MTEGPQSLCPAPSSLTRVSEGQVGSVRVSGRPQGRAWQRGVMFCFCSLFFFKIIK